MVTKVRDATTPSSKFNVLSSDLTSPCGVEVCPDVNPNAPLDAELPVSLTLLSRNLLLFTALKTIGSFDSGAFSAALGAENGVAEEWMLSTVQQGTLTSSVFLGNIVGCPLSGNLFSRYSAKSVLVWSLILHTVFTFLFATIIEYRIALLCRFCIGVTLSFVIVYTPVWVDEFAPKDRQSVWMASHNAGVPLGIMLGYSLGAFLPSYTNVNWEWAFYIKCIITIPVLACLIRVDRRSIDRRGARLEPVSVAERSPERHSTSARIFGVLHTNFLYLWRTCAPLFYNLEYMCSTLAMCSLYFVVTGLQNFVTQYLRDEPFNASMKTIMLGFGAAVVTAPVFGVITGGVLLDRIGGYQSNLFHVTLFTCAWGATAAFFSIICIFLTDTMSFLAIISIVLFCGGAIIPPGSGTVMSSVPNRLRPAGAALSQMMYNLLGNFSGPMVCGFVADMTGKLSYGIYTVLAFSVVGLIPMLVLLQKAYRLRGQPNPLRGRRQAHTTEVIIHGSTMETAGHESPRRVCVGDDINDVLPAPVHTPTGPHVMRYTASAANTTPTNSLNSPSQTLGPMAARHSPHTEDDGSAGGPPTAPHCRESPSSTQLEDEVATETNDADNTNNDTNTNPRDDDLHSSNGTPMELTYTLNINALSATRDTCVRQRVGPQETQPQQQELFVMEEIGSDSMNDLLEIETGAAHMMSFPSQHHFGLDVLRSWLSSSRRSRQVVSIHSSVDTIDDVRIDANSDVMHDSHRSLSVLNDAPTSISPSLGPAQEYPLDESTYPPCTRQ